MAHVRRLPSHRPFISLFYVPLLVLIVYRTGANAQQNIISFGAIVNDSSNSAAKQNSIALQQALDTANLPSSTGNNRTVLVPAGGDFVIFEVRVQRLSDVTLQIDGNLVISNNITAWPKSVPQGVLAAVSFTDCNNILVTGSGNFDGQGYDWWWYVFLTGIDNRPVMLVMESCIDCLITNLTFRNSPEYHVDVRSIQNMVIENIKVRVDVVQQKAIMRRFGALVKYGELWRREFGTDMPSHTADGTPLPPADLEIPVFPLNTDGIDVSGVNVTIRNCSIENFDDAVAVKPLTSTSTPNCTRDIVVVDCETTFSVGMSIGSVPSNPDHNCIDGVIIKRVKMQHPIKALYVKTNPPDNPSDPGSGQITNINYMDMEVTGSLWYPIWIGPQQQKQPDTNGTGCSFFYPIVDECPTNPNVNVSGIRLTDITLKRGLLMPGVVLCDNSTKCSDIMFDEVDNQGEFLVQKDYVCKNVIDSSVVNSTPNPGCFGSSSDNHRSPESGAKRATPKMDRTNVV